MTDTAKDIIYIDIDDEITSIVEKVRGSKHKITALVLPKRAAMLQSVVNMKLLKKAADQADKSLVLITSDSNLLPLAGSVGLHVARSLQTKPVIPPAPVVATGPETITTDLSEPPEVDKTKTLEELDPTPVAEEDETIEVDNSEPAAEPDAKKDRKTKKDKKFKIPNFESFRLRLFLVGGALLLLLIGWVFAFMILPKAHVVIKTDTTSITTGFDFTASTDIKEVKVPERELPAELREVKKTDTQKVPATGQKDVGDRATGTMTVYNCSDDDVSLPAGTTFTNNSLSFGANQAVTVPASDFFSNGNCKKNKSATVPVTANEGGDKYNLSAGREYSSNFASSVSGTGSAMTGGTTKLVKVVSQSDIDTAKQNLTSKPAADVTAELQKALSDSGYFGIAETLNSAPGEATSSPAVGAEAEEVTVTINTTHTMIGVKEDDMKRLIEEDANTQIDTTQQQIQDAGTKDAAIRLKEKQGNRYILSLQTLVKAGPKIDTEQIKKEVLGKKRGDAEAAISNRPGISEARISYSPFWVFSTPKSTKKITVTIESPPPNAVNP